MDEKKSIITITELEDGRMDVQIEFMPNYERGKSCTAHTWGVKAMDLLLKEFNRHWEEKTDEINELQN